MYSPDENTRREHANGVVRCSGLSTFVHTLFRQEELCVKCSEVHVEDLLVCLPSGLHVLHNLELQDPSMRKLIWRILNELPACATHGYHALAFDAP